MRARDIQFKVEVLSVKEKSMPELDDEFAKSVGDGFDDLEALRTSIRESLTNQAENAARSELEQKSLDALCEVAVVNASPLLFDRELEAMQADRERMLRQQGLDLATYLRFMGKSPDEFLDEMRPNAERRLVSALVMRKLAEVEEIEVSDEDIQSETDRLLDLSSGGRGAGHFKPRLAAGVSWIGIDAGQHPVNPAQPAGHGAADRHRAGQAG